MNERRPRILAPEYHPSLDPGASVLSSPTAPGRPAVTRESDSDDATPITALGRDVGIGAEPRCGTLGRCRFLPPPIASNPALLSSGGDRRDITFNDQVEQLEMEVEMAKNRRRYVQGVDTEDLNAMLRAFDKQVQHVRLCSASHVARIPPGLDLHPDPEEELSAQKVRSALERLYASAGMGLYRFGREIQRIRIWEDGTRTTIALAVYAYAWWCDLIVATLLSFLSILVLIPSSRRFFFESAVRRRIPGDDAQAVQQTIKGRTESTWGPAATEASAARWAESVQDVVGSMSTGKIAEEEKTIKTDLKEQVEDGADQTLDDLKAAGQADPEDDQRSRKELVTRMYAQPAMRVLAGLADEWERINHALQPKGGTRGTDRRWAVFLQVLLPLIVISVTISERAISSASGFACGLLLFGQPLLSHLISELDRTFPDWKSKLILELNLFDTVPTNAQLVLDLLRDAERRRRPIPPAPDPDTPLPRSGQYLSDTSDDDSLKDDDDHLDDKARQKRNDLVSELSHVAQKGKEGSRAKVRKVWDILGKTKEDSFAMLAGHKTVDVHSTAERLLDKLHISPDHRIVAAALDRVPRRARDDSSGDTPSSFYVWHKRHGPGHVVIHPHDPSTETAARIEFSTIRRVRADENVSIDPRRDPQKGHLVVPINDIIGLRKLDLGTIKRTALSWALDSERAGGTGLEVTIVRRHLHDADKHTDEPALELNKEEKITLTSIVRRDELFNRLIALGSQRWEMV